MVNYLHPPTHPDIKKKIGFQKGGLPAQNQRLKFRSPEQNNIPKENQLDPTGVRAHPFGG